MTRKRYIHLIAVVATVALLSTLWAATQTYAQFNVRGGRIDAFTFYIPYEADRLDDQFNVGQSAANLTDADIETTISIAVKQNGSVIYYDQWEDGLEPDLTTPSQFSTLIWGDGNPANNNTNLAPGVQVTGIPANDILTDGTVITLRNIVVVPRNPAQLFFDGGDALTSVDGVIAVSVTFWTDPPFPATPGILFTDAWELYPTNRWGTDYRIPIGEDLGPAGSNQRGGFTIVSLNVQAVEDNTTIEVDLDADGNFETTVTRNQGGQFNVIQGVRTGARVRASAPVQVHIFAADPTQTYEARGYTMVPFDQWTNDYLAPRSSDGDFWLYNPNGAPLTITAETSGGVTTNFNIPANSTVKFPAAGLSAATGTRFTAAGGNFYGLAALDADSAQDWGHALLPTNNLTTQVLIGLGLGNANQPPNGNESRVYVTAVNNTTVSVIFRDGSTTSVAVAPLAEVPITAPNNDMTGAFLFTTNDVPFAAVWGQDQGASLALPSIDAGTSITPLRSLVLQKTYGLLDDVDCSGSITLGDAVRFELQYFNYSANPVLNVMVEDALPGSLIYVPGSTTLNGASIPDETTGTPFLLDAGGYNAGTVVQQSSGFITFDATVNNAAGAITNQANASTQSLPLGGDAVTVFMPTGTGGSILQVNKALVAPANGTIVSGQTVTFSLTITNAGNSTITILPLQDTFNEDHLTFLAAGVPPDITASGVITWNDLTIPLGDLPPGAAINTSINFVVDQLPPNVSNSTLVASVVGALQNNSPTRLTCRGNAALNFANPPTPTPTPTSTPFPLPPPTSPPSGGGNTTPRPPTLTPVPESPTPTPAPVAFVPDTNVLPVTLLPETGIWETYLGPLELGLLLLLVLSGASVLVLFLRRRLK